MGLGDIVISPFPGMDSSRLAKEAGDVFAYGFYISHLVLSLIVKTKRTFVILMIILIIAVCLNLADCVEGFAGVGQIKG